MKISIITASYNSEKTILNSIQSVNSQTWNAIEHIFVDGSSTDSTIDCIHQTSEREKIIISEPDKGIYDAMNKGILASTGEIVGILNSDDFYIDSNVLTLVCKLFEENQSIEACYGDLVYVKEIFDAKSSQIKINKSIDFKIVRYWKSSPFTLNMFRWGWMPPHPTFFVRRKVYEKFGLFNLHLGSAADYELMLRLLLKYHIKAAYIPNILSCMRTGGVSNASLKNRIKANHMDRKAWVVNGLKPYPWTIPLKPVCKISQFLRKPCGDLLLNTCIGQNN